MRKNVFNEYLKDLHLASSSFCMKTLEVIARELTTAFLESQIIAVCGNGGSSSTAGHLVCDLYRVAGNARIKTKIFDLTANTATLTAISNDISYESSLATQINRVLNEKDLLICFSVSGTSPNIVKAIEQAQEIGVKVILITGQGEGKNYKKSLATIQLTINSSNVYIVEDMHLTVVHMLTLALENSLTQSIQPIT